MLHFFLTYFLFYKATLQLKHKIKLNMKCGMEERNLSVRTQE